MFYLFHKKNIISPKEGYNLLNSMDKGEKEILLAFIKQEIEIEQKKNSLEGGVINEQYRKGTKS